MKFIVRHIKDSSNYKIFTKRIDAIRFIAVNPSYVMD